MGWTAEWAGATFKRIDPATVFNGSLAHAVEPYNIASNQAYAGAERPIWGYFVDQVEEDAIDATNEALASVKVRLPPFCSYLEIGVLGRWNKVSGTSRIQVECTETGDSVAAAGIHDANAWYRLRGIDPDHTANQPRAIHARDTTTYPLDEWATATLTLTLSNESLVRAYWRCIPAGGTYSVP